MTTMITAAIAPTPSKNAASATVPTPIDTPKTTIMLTARLIVLVAQRRPELRTARSISEVIYQRPRCARKWSRFVIILQSSYYPAPGNRTYEGIPVEQLLFHPSSGATARGPTGGILRKCVAGQAVYPLSEQDGLKAQERRYTAYGKEKH